MDLFDRVKQIIVEQLKWMKNKVTLDASFVDDLGADSLDIVELVMTLEEEFDLEIPDEDAEHHHGQQCRQYLRDRLNRSLTAL